MAEHFLVSVGTSLIGQYNHWRGEHETAVSAREEDWTDPNNPHVKKWEDCLSRFLSMQTPESLPGASAELSSLLKDSLKSPRANDSVVFIHTDTRSAAACAQCLKEAFAQVAGGAVGVTCRKVEGLSEVSSDQFYSRGLPNLIGLLLDEISNARGQGRKVVLVPTGGYKAIIPYFVLIGILHKAPCRYVYEESSLVMELPALPLHADLAEWTGIESVIETFCGQAKEDAAKSRLYYAYKELLVNLLSEDGRCFKRMGVCELLQERVERDRRRSELQFRTQNSPLLLYLLKPTGTTAPADETLKQLFLKLAEIGPYIWKGDRVPEMADHALLHHADLFHLAERILLPVFYFYELSGRDEPFLNPEELFVLLGALHLHDCGHVVGSVDRVEQRPHRLLPTEVRDHHHILGYLRLTDPDGHGATGRWIHDALKSPKGSACTRSWKESDLAQALHAIATLGLYHRKAMKLRQTEPEPQKYPYAFICGASFKEVPNLCEFLAWHPLEVGGKRLDPDRVELLVCLLRIIDSLDEQGLRTGGREAVQFHIQQLETEAREEYERAEGLRSAIEAVEGALSCLGVSQTSRCTRVDGLIDRLLASYRGKESKKKAAEATHAAESKGLDFWAEFDAIFSDLDPLRQLGLEYAFSRVRAMFKEFQKEPYAEKIDVEAIDIRHSFEEGKVVFRIGLRMERTYLENPFGKKDPSGLLSAMAKEYEVCERLEGKDVRVVCQVLEKAGIMLCYGMP